MICICSVHAKLDKYVVEDFEDSDSSIVWSPVGQATSKVIDAPKTTRDYRGIIRKAQKKSLEIIGTADDYYVGGIRAKLSGVSPAYTHIRLMIFSKGHSKGKLNIELYDDDNSNQVIDRDSDGTLTHDDKLSYTVYVNWTGWKQVVVPLSRFSDKNKSVGDDKWDPGIAGGTISINELELGIVSSSKTGSIYFAVDNIEFLRVEKF